MKNNRLISRILFFFLLISGSIISCTPGGNPNGSASPPRDSCHTIGLTYKDTCIKGIRVFEFSPTATSAACGTFISYTLYFGDGTQTSGVSPFPTGPINHVYSGTGPYTAQLTVIWPPCAIGPKKCDTSSTIGVITHSVTPCGGQTDSCPNCTVSVKEDSCILGAGGIMRRQVTFTPNCTGPAGSYYVYDLKGGTSPTPSWFSTLPAVITAFYENNPSGTPTLTVLGPGNCPPKTINIPYTTVTPCPPKCPDITNIAVSVVDSCATVNGVRGHWVTLTPTVVNGTAANYIWIFSSGSPMWSGPPPPGNPVAVTHFYPTSSSGPYSAALLIYGPDGKLCDSLTVTFNMKPCTCDPCDTIVNIQVQQPDCSQVLNGIHTVTFTATISGQCPPGAYLWNFGDGSPTVTTYGPTVTHDYLCPRSVPAYFVTLNLVGCEGNPFYVSPSKTVPISFASCGCPTIENINIDQTACILNVSATIGGYCPDAVTQYIWDFGDGTSVAVTPPSTNATHTYTSSGDYWVTLTLAGVGPDCYSAKLIHVDCGGDPGGPSECFHWPLKKWYCWLFTILFAIAFIALAITLLTSIITNAGASWATCLALFLVALALAILLAILCHCCFALWALYYLLLLVTIILLLLALATNAFWGSFFIALALTIIVAILIYVFCGSCLALWILFFLFLVLCLIFLGYALCILSGGGSAPPGFWFKFVLMIILAIIIAVIIHKLCGAPICAILLSLTSATTLYALILSVIDARFRPCTTWLTGSTAFPAPPASPIFVIPNMWFYTTFLWLIWYIVCHLLG